MADGQMESDQQSGLKEVKDRTPASSETAAKKGEQPSQAKSNRQSGTPGLFGFTFRELLTENRRRQHENQLLQRQLQAEELREHRQSKREFAAILVAFLATIFAAWQAYESRQTRIDARRATEIARMDAGQQARQAREDSEKALAAQRELSERSARAAEQSAAIAKLAVQTGERAYITNTAANKEPIVPEVPFKVSALFRNTGKTPALNVQIRPVLHAQYGTLTQVINVAANAEVKYEFGTGSRSPIPPGEYVLNSTTAPRAYTAKEVKAIENREIWVVYVGRIEYADVFGNSHSTHFCFFYDTRHEKAMSTCPTGNTMN